LNRIVLNENAAHVFIERLFRRDTIPILVIQPVGKFGWNVGDLRWDYRSLWFKWSSRRQFMPRRWLCSSWKYLSEIHFKSPL
jgi:hypothetical protein